MIFPISVENLLVGLKFLIQIRKQDSKTNKQKLWKTRFSLNNQDCAIFVSEFYDFIYEPEQNFAKYGTTSEPQQQVGNTTIKKQNYIYI